MILVVFTFPIKRKQVSSLPHKKSRSPDNWVPHQKKVCLAEGGAGEAAWGITKHKTLLIMETTSHMKTIVVPVTMETSVTMVMKLTEDMPSIMPRIIHCLLQDGGMRITGLIEIRHHLKEEAGAYWMPKQWPLILSLTKPLKSDLEKCIS